MDKCSRAGGGDEGLRFCTCWAALSDSTANSTDRLFRDWRRVPQVLCEEAKEGRVEPSEPSVLWKTVLCQGQNVSMQNVKLPNSFQANSQEESWQHWGCRAQNLWILEKDCIAIGIKYLSSLPNIRRSVAFSLERSAIFSALSRSLWKLLWIFLISSLLVENWTWMSVGRHSYNTDPT